jgi:hypothetical protein
LLSPFDDEIEKLLQLSFQNDRWPGHTIEFHPGIPANP